MLRTMIVTIATLMTATAAYADEPPTAVEVPATATTQPVRVLTGTVVDSMGGSDLHGGWVKVHLDGQPEGLINTFSDIVFPHTCTTLGDKFYIVFGSVTTSITCGDPTK